jgi:hypothetical protein
MKKIIEFVKNYKIYILSSLLVIFFFRSCSKSGDVRKLEKVNIRTTKIVDSLTTVIKGQKDTINNISEVIRVEKIKIHTEYDNYTVPFLYKYREENDKEYGKRMKQLEKEKEIKLHAKEKRRQQYEALRKEFGED